MPDLGQDLRFALRALSKSRGFTAVAVLSLALGIGANTAVFTLLDQALLRRLPVRAPEQLALLSTEGEHYGNSYGGSAISYPLYLDLSRNNQVFSGMLCRFRSWAGLGYGGDTERVSVELVSGSYFPVLGVPAALGRTFTAAEDEVPGGHPVAMLSHDYWRSRFGADPQIVGKKLAINGHQMTVVGVAAAGFNGVELERPPQVFVPMTMKPQITPLWNALDDRRTRFVNAFGRLKAGVTREAAARSLQPYFKGVLEMEVREPAFRSAAPETRQAFLRSVLVLQPGSQGRSRLRQQLEGPLVVLMALTAAVMLIACGNVASLLIARAAAREKEIALRIALGAARARIVRLLIVESLVLAAAGGAAGIGLAYGTNRVLFGLLPPDIATLKLSPEPDLRILLFTAATALLTALLFGFAPAIRSTRPELAPTLKAQAGSLAGGVRQARLRKTLVATQVALSLLLLVGAGLFVRSLMNLRGMGPGFATERLLAFNLNPSLNGYTPDQSKALFARLTQELRSVPGVTEVGLASIAILQDNNWDSSVTVEGHENSREPADPQMNMVGPGYFAALGVPFVAGRDFTPADDIEIKHREPDEWQPRAVIVNQKFARRFFGDGNPIGRRVGFGSDPGTPVDMEIVGVVKDIKYTNLKDEIRIQMFVPYIASRFVAGMTAYVRTTLPAETIVAAARDRVRRLDSGLPVFGIRTMEERVGDSLLLERLVAGLSAAFGALATLLACVGLYGVMAYSVARRTREIGVRMALGALGRDVVWLVLRELLLLLGVGLAVGLPAALVLARYVRSQLYGVGFADPLTLGLAAVSLTGAAALAGLIPARRASRVDPMRALRYE